MKSKIVGTLVILLLAAISFNFTFSSKVNSKTVDNLKDAITGETTASAKYLSIFQKS